MTKLMVRIGLTAIAAIALAAPTLAIDGPDSVLSGSGTKPGVVDFARNAPVFDGSPAVPLPMPADPDPGNAGLAMKSSPSAGRPGPIGSLPDSNLFQTGGNALVGPSGGLFISPQMRGKREIQRMMKSLG